MVAFVFVVLKKGFTKIKNKMKQKLKIFFLVPFVCISLTFYLKIYIIFL